MPPSWTTSFLCLQRRDRPPPLSQPKTVANYVPNILHKEVPGLHHVYAVTDQENAPSSVAVLERVRPRREGAFAENAWFEGRWSSGYLCAATLREEWLAWA